MKVEYIKCDICGEKLITKQIRYSLKDFYGEIQGNPMDICPSCVDRMVKWIKKEIKNGTST